MKDEEMENKKEKMSEKGSPKQEKDIIVSKS
jgi:hypothetical protein